MHQAGLAELNAARATVGVEVFRFFHGTSWDTAQQILLEGFKPSQEGCLGPGIYVARYDKAEKFAKQFTRHGGKVGGLVELLVEVKRPKFVEINRFRNDSSWRDEGYDACRANRTTASEHMEWCIADRTQVKVIKITPIRCDGDMSGAAVAPEDEEHELERHAADLEAKIRDDQKKVDLIRSWISGIKQKREQERAEKERQEKEKREEEEREQARKLQEEAQIMAIALQAAEKKLVNEKRRARGERMTYWLHDNEHVSKIWCGDTTACVAMGCAGDADSAACTAMLYDDSGHAWTSGMPTLLHNKLNGRGARKKPWPVYLAMGSLNRYYLQFENGSYEWVASDLFEEKTLAMENIKTVAFGTNFDSFFILSEGGGYSWQGIPEAMNQGMNSNKYRKKIIDDVSLGPDGEWFVRWKDGSWKGGGYSDNISDKLDELKQHSIKKILFGPSESWFVRYT
jgi:hypothetical protein